MSKSLEVLEKLYSFAIIHYSDNEMRNEIINAKREIEKELKEYELFTTPNKTIEDTFMSIEKDGSFYFCGDAYCGNINKEGLLEIIKDLIYYYYKM